MERIENFMLYALVSWIPWAVLTGWLLGDPNIGGVIGLCQFLIAAILMIGYDDEHSNL